MDVVCDDGWVLHADRIPAVGPVKGVIVVLHAMMVDRRSMDRPRGRGLASVLADQGFEVLNADFRGHGKSGPSVKEGGSWTYDDLVLQDVPTLVRAARRLDLGPVHIVGLSLGGHVSAASVGMGACEVDGLVMLSANTWSKEAESSWSRSAAKDLTLRAFRTVARVVGHWPSKGFGIGPANEALPYVEDLVRYWTEDRWASRDGVDWAVGLRQVPCRALLVIGRGDVLLAHPVGAHRWASPIPQLSFALVGKGQLGMTRDPGHMDLSTSRDCAGLWRWIAVWLAADA